MRSGERRFRSRLTTALVLTAAKPRSLATSASDAMRTCELGPESTSIHLNKARMLNDQRKLPLESKASAARRRALSRGSLSEDEANKRLDGPVTASEARRAGRILGVWVQMDLTRGRGLAIIC